MRPYISAMAPCVSSHFSDCLSAPVKLGLEQPLRIAGMLPRIVERALHVAEVSRIAVDGVEFGQSAHHHRREPHVALVDDAEGLAALGRELPEEAVR